MHEISLLVQKKYSDKIVKLAKEGRIMPSDSYQSIVSENGDVITFLLNRNDKNKLQAMVVGVSKLAC